MQQPEFHGIPIEAGNPEEIFEILQVLGKGTFGTVIKARNKQTNEIVAIKQILLGKDDEIDIVRKEVKILNECVHPNIVRYRGTYISLNTLWIVMEYCAGGSVDAVFRVLKRPLSERLIAYVMREVLAGLVYLHAQHKIHRDIKGGNILLGQNGEVKLADFGVSTELVHTMSRRNSFIGTLYWMAPEAIQEKEYDERADMWSLGITAIEIAESQPPYMHMHYGRALLAIPRDPPPVLQAKDRWSAAMHKFVSRLLIKDLSQRPTAAQMSKDPFVNNDRIGNAAELAAIVEEIQARMATMNTARRLGEESSESSSNATFVEVDNRKAARSSSSQEDDTSSDEGRGSVTTDRLDLHDANRPNTSFIQEKKRKKKASPQASAQDGGADVASGDIAGRPSSSSAGGGVAAQASLHVWSLNGTLPDLPLLSCDDFTLDELGGDSSGISPVGKVPAALALLTQPSARLSVGGEPISTGSSSSPPPDPYVNCTTTSLMGIYHSLRDAHLRRGLAPGEAERLRALATKYGSALKTILRI